MTRSITAVKQEVEQMKKMIYMMKVSTVFSMMISISLVLAK